MAANSLNTGVRIPKILHLYWEDRPMSWLQAQTVTTFHKHNPRWEIRIYVPLQKDSSPVKYIPDYTGKDYFVEVRKLPYVQIIDIDVIEYGIHPELHNILRSDIFRYNILYEVGGLWSDFDVLWLKPAEHIFKISSYMGDSIKDMGVSVCRYEFTNNFHNIAVLYAKPYHPLYKKLIEECMKIQNSTEDKNTLSHQVFGTDLWDVLWSSFQECKHQFPDAVAVPYQTFYPYSIYEMNDLYKKSKVENVLDSEVICLHWFNGYWQSKDYVNNIEHQDCSMTRILSLIKSNIL